MKILSTKFKYLFGCLLIITMNMQLFGNNSCQALFDYEPYDGPLPTVGGVTFHNLSSGNFTNLSWDFGDASFSSDNGTFVDHFYTESGVFTVCLNVWNGQDCSEQYCKEINIDIADQSCSISDCVYPGDANYDGDANLYDLMTIGIGLGENGPPRPNATIEFTPQPAPDWTQYTPGGINYKHLDCDGNGNISNADLLAIIKNYRAIKHVVNNVESDGPAISLVFDTDTIVIDENTPDKIMVTAGLMVGTGYYPVQDIYSLGLYLNYDTTYITTANGVTVEFPGNSFLGSTANGALLPYGIDVRPQEQIDMAFTRTDGQDVSGSGRIATLSFIIDADIIDGRAEPTDPAIFEVPLGGVKVANSKGDERFVSWSKKAARIVFLTPAATTATNQAALAKKVKLYPNPVTDEMTIELNGLQPQSVSIYNLLGKLMHTQDLSHQKTTLKLGSLESGIYQLHIQTEAGSVIKRIVIY